MDMKFDTVLYVLLIIEFQPANAKPMAYLGLVLFPSLTTIRPVSESQYLRGLLASLT